MSNITEHERALLRQQAEAYAFIYDLREQALLNGTAWVVSRTQGLEAKIEQRRKQYPRLFSRYFKEARERAKRHVVEKTNNGTREEVQRRKAQAVEERKIPRRRKNQKDNGKKEKPE